MHTLDQLRDGTLAGISRLQLSCGLTEFPREIFELADSLTILDLTGNALSSLPDDLPRLHQLRVIFCSSNQFEVLPAVLGACAKLTMIGFKSNRIGEVPAAALPPSLRWLILTDNRIAALPASIGRCSQLQKLMLAGNHLRELPPSLAHCSQLELLRIAANRLTSLPAWLGEMPRLAWLAFAGNPFSADAESAAAAGAGRVAIAWPHLQLQQILGEGASGVIYRASLQQADPAGAAGETGAEAVAVKLFKGAITSDGLPRCELAAALWAGPHPALIPVRGEVSEHPDGVHGCVMALIDPAFRSLAGPPSLDSCTRDIYPAGLRFSLAAVLALAHAIATAAQHLHGRGIMHGDLYGHNILHRAGEDGADALLGDFGAASLFDRDGAQAQQLQRLEVRAFGLLLGELIARCDAGDAADADKSAKVPSDGASKTVARLRALMDACVQAPPACRPAFDDIVGHLQGMPG